MWVIIRGLTWFWHAGMVNILFLSAKYFYLRWIVEFLIVEFAYANAFVLLVLLIKTRFPFVMVLPVTWICYFNLVHTSCHNMDVVVRLLN